MSSRTVGLIVAGMIGGIAALGWAVAIWTSTREATAEMAVEQGLGITSDFELVDQAGKAIRIDDFADKWQLCGFRRCWPGIPE